MKKATFFLIIIAIVCITISCGNKTKKPNEKPIEKATTFKELQLKYDNKEFKNCDAFIEAGNEIIDVLIKTVNAAYDGNEQAIAEFNELVEFTEQFDKQSQHFEEKCPEKMEEFNLSADKKMEPIMSKLIELSIHEMAIEMNVENVQTNDSNENDLSNAL